MKSTGEQFLHIDPLRSWKNPPPKNQNTQTDLKTVYNKFKMLRTNLITLLEYRK